MDVDGNEEVEEEGLMTVLAAAMGMGTGGGNGEEGGVGVGVVESLELSYRTHHHTPPTTTTAGPTTDGETQQQLSSSSSSLSIHPVFRALSLAKGLRRLDLGTNGGGGGGPLLSVGDVREVRRVWGLCGGWGG